MLSPSTSHKLCDIFFALSDHTHCHQAGCWQASQSCQPGGKPAPAPREAPPDDVDATFAAAAADDDDEAAGDSGSDDGDFEDDEELEDGEEVKVDEGEQKQRPKKKMVSLSLSCTRIGSFHVSDCCQCVHCKAVHLMPKEVGSTKQCRGGLVTIALA